MDDDEVLDPGKNHEIRVNVMMDVKPQDNLDLVYDS
jgi:hypothetical protein